MPLRAIVTQSTTADCTQAVALIDGFTAGNLLEDRGYDTDEILNKAESQGMAPVIPSKKNRTTQRDHDKELYKARHMRTPSSI
jgi:transposase